MGTGTWPDINDIIGILHRFLIMFDDNHRVAQITQAMQRIDQADIVALVQPDARLIQNI